LAVILSIEDFLHLALCSLSGGDMEEQYLATVRKHAEGLRGKRGSDKLAELFGRLVDVMESTRADILGDLFQGAITYGEAGQYLTPESITSVMATMSLHDMGNHTERRRVLDPCCGSGRMLLAVAEQCPHWEFVGQDVDLRCVRMTAINLALRNLYGHVIEPSGQNACSEVDPGNWTAAGGSLDSARRADRRTPRIRAGIARGARGEWLHVPRGSS